MIAPEQVPKMQNGGYQDIQTGIFLISKWLGLFPINVRSEELSISLANILVPVALRSAIFIFVVVAESIRTFDFSDAISYRIYIFYGSLISGMIIMPVTLMYQVYNLETYSRIMKTLSEVDNMAEVPLMKLKWKINIAMFVTINLVSLVYEGFFFFKGLIISPSMLLYYLITADIFLVASQFTEFVRMATLRLDFLCNTTKVSTLERWCQCQEILCTFTKDINKCYATQLSLTLLSCLLYFSSRIYVIINTKNNVIRTDYSYWILLSFVFLWRICSMCRESVLRAKKFDDKLYKLIIKDKSRRLLKNKKIMLHFRVQTVEDFTALGCFRFDFPLLCTIISAAVSSVLIMIQFA
ncbi:Gustatory receptor 150a [Halyomorpha halys]|nr:Gustatory receptor 150a [Halyomorpha halys]